MTKDTDERVAKSRETLKKRYASGELIASYKGKHWSDEDKKRISEHRKKYLAEHPEKVPYLLNHSSKASYPEQYFKNVFEKECIPLKYHKQISLYQLDFYNDDCKRYVEIDGSTHDLQKVKEIDERRTEYLKSIGWIGMRIKWNDYQKLNENERKSVIEKIKQFILLQ